jgi:hypothetical protein
MVKQLELSADGPYCPSIRKTRKWFKVLNKLIFKTQLPPFYRVKISSIKDAWANCLGFEEKGIRWCSVHLDKKFPSEAHFVTVLIHEMVHNYEWCILKKDMSHGPDFFKWKEKLNSLGVPLHKKYKVDKP